MKLQPLLFTGIAVGLSACAAPVVSPPQALAAFPVAVGGRDYQALIVPGGPGHALGARGAAPVAGRTIRVVPLGFDEGRRAKEVAAAACAQARGRFQPQALGRASGNEWIFEGGCA